MSELLHILVAEDDDVDAFIIQCELCKLKTAFTLKRIGAKDNYLQQLEAFGPDAVIASYSFGGLAKLVATRNTWPRIPFLVIRTSPKQRLEVNGETIVTEYFLKNNLGHLASTVEKLAAPALAERQATARSSAPAARPQAAAAMAGVEARTSTVAVPTLTADSDSYASITGQIMAAKAATAPGSGRRTATILPLPAAPARDEERAATLKLEAKLNAHRQTEQSLRASVAKLEQNLGSISGERDALARQLTEVRDLQAKSLAERNELQVIQSRLNAKNEECNRAEKRISELLRLSEEASRLQKELEQRINGLTAAQSATHELLQLEKARREKVEVELEARTRQAGETSREIEQEQGEAVARLQADLRERTQEIGTLRLSVDALARERDELSEQLHRLQDHQSRLVVESRSDLESELARVRSELENATRAISEQAQHHSDLEGKLSESSRQLAEKSARLNDLAARLRADASERRQLQDKLHQISDDLERTVSQRTAELTARNAEIRALSRHLQTGRDEERLSLMKIVQGELEPAVEGLRSDAVQLLKLLRAAESGPAQSVIFAQARRLAGSVERALLGSGRISSSLSDWAGPAPVTTPTVSQTSDRRPGSNPLLNRGLARLKEMITESIAPVSR